MFDNFEQLKEYTGEWLSESDLVLVWQWVQKGMVTPDQVVKTTKDCRSEEACVVGNLKHNAWQTFIKNYKP